MKSNLIIVVLLEHVFQIPAFVYDYGEGLRKKALIIPLAIFNSRIFLVAPDKNGW